MKQHDDSLVFENDIKKNKIIITRKLKRKGLTKKEFERIQNSIARVEIYSFDISDLEKLQRLAVELSSQMANAKMSKYAKVLYMAYRFLIK
jgi:CRISPR/Cas system-associated endoribonuclease Cas2